MLKYEEIDHFSDVVAYRADPVMSHKTVVIPTLVVDVVAGSLITSAGEAYTSGDDLLIVLDKHAAGSSVPVIVVDKDCIIKRSALKGTAAAITAAIAVIEADGKNRLSVEK